MWKSQTEAAFCIEGSGVIDAVCNTELRLGIFQYLIYIGYSACLLNSNFQLGLKLVKLCSFSCISLFGI